MITGDLCVLALGQVYRRQLAAVMTLRQIALLGVICQHPGQSTGALAKQVNVPKPVVVRALRTMREMNLVRQHSDISDGRKICVFATEHGLTVRGEMVS